MGKASAFGKLAAVIGLIASCIGIFAFVTNVQSIPQLLGMSRQEITTPTKIMTREPTKSEPTLKNITPVSTPRPTSTLTTRQTTIPTLQPTTTPLIIAFDHPNVQIEMVNGKTGVEVRIFAGGQIMPDVSVRFSTAIKDAIGKWRSVTYGDVMNSDPTTGIVSADLKPGTYGITGLWAMSGPAEITGRWGISDPNQDYFPRQIIPFPVNNGMRTKITVNLGIIRVLVLRSDGNVETDDHVNLYCQARDVNGSIIKSPDCHSSPNNSFIFPNTDRATGSYTPEGYTIFYVGSGPYLLCYYGCGDVPGPSAATDITVGPNQIRDVQLINRYR